MSTHSTTVRREFNRLFLDSLITEEEFGNLLAYIFRNPDKIPDLEDSLKFGTDNVKVIYLRNILLSERLYANEQEIRYYKYENFLLKLGNTQNSVSVYRFTREQGDFKNWEIGEDPDIKPQRGIGNDVFIKYPDAPAQGSSEINATLFCKNVINEIVNSMHSGSLRVYGDVGSRKVEHVYADIIIGHTDFHKELTDNPPDLSKGLGWEIKNLNDGSKVSEGKGKLIKYARAYLSASPPLTNVFYGCLTDGKFWQFVKIQLMLNDINNLKVKFEESYTYEWSIKTASLIAGIIDHYHNELSMRASGEKKDNNETYMYRNKSSISPDSLLASFIKEGIYIKLYSGNCIHVQITSHLGNGRECIVFLVQVHDYGMKDAVLKIEVRKDSEISQVYREISALHALGDLSCVPTILFEGYTLGGFLALLTDFAGQPLESWNSDNGNIDDYTIFQIILDLLSCLEKIHARGYTHGDVAIRNVIRRNGHFYLIDFGLATLLQLLSDPCQAIIKDYFGLCRIIGIIKFGETMAFSELIDKLKGELKSFVVFVVEVASRWQITDEGKWLEKFGAEVKLVLNPLRV